jgi:hypothetical protein
MVYLWLILIFWPNEKCALQKEHGQQEEMAKRGKTIKKTKENMNEKNYLSI